MKPMKLTNCFLLLFCICSVQSSAQQLDTTILIKEFEAYFRPIDSLRIVSKIKNVHDSFADLVHQQSGSSNSISTINKMNDYHRNEVLKSYDLQMAMITGEAERKYGQVNENHLKSPDEVVRLREELKAAQKTFFVEDKKNEIMQEIFRLDTAKKSGGLDLPTPYWAPSETKTTDPAQTIANHYYAQITEYIKRRKCDLGYLTTLANYERRYPPQDYDAIISIRMNFLSWLQTQCK
jgi:hypothetical protein